MINPRWDRERENNIQCLLIFQHIKWLMHYVVINIINNLTII